MFALVDKKDEPHFRFQSFLGHIDFVIMRLLGSPNNLFWCTH